MSFSSDIKQELNKNNSLSNKELVKCELIGYLISANISIINRTENNITIKFSTESDYNINRFSKLLSNIDIDHKINISGKTFVIDFQYKEIKEYIKLENNLTLYDEQIKEIQAGKLTKEKVKAIVKGAFMGSGSINNPSSEYHLEIIFNNFQNLKAINEMINKFGIKTKILEQKNKYSIYLKDGEEISKFLALIGANNAVLKFEDIRIRRQMRGKVNRLVNCETANLNKTINSSVQQINAINKLKKEKKFHKLNDNLKEIAEVRINNPNASLVELGQLLEKPLGKSGVNYRLKKIMELANE